jgi:hypothetical protein
VYFHRDRAIERRRIADGQVFLERRNTVLSCNHDDKNKRKLRNIYEEEREEGKNRAGYASDPDWIRLRAALLKVLEEHPAARAAVIHAIEENRGKLGDREGADVD